MEKEEDVVNLQQNVLIMIDLHVKVKENQNVGQQENVKQLVHLLKEDVEKNVNLLELENMVKRKNVVIHVKHVNHSNIQKHQKKRGDACQTTKK